MEKTSKTKTIRLSAAGLEELEKLLSRMKANLPPGIKLSEGEVIENALIEKARTIDGK